MPQYAEFSGYITLIDQRGHEATRRFNLDKAVNAGIDPPFEPGARYARAYDALSDIVAEINASSTAVVKRSGVITTASESSALGPVGSDVTDEALMVYFINETGQREKLWSFGIPSPAPAIFQADLISVNLGETAALSAMIAGNAFVSDGEEINTALGVDGQKAGVWRSRQKRGQT
jgi:hypothetical protein